MTEFLRYLRAQLLRARKLFPAVLVFALTVALCVSVILVNLLEKTGAEEDRKRIRVGLVGDLSEDYLNIGVFAIQNFDSSKQYLEFVTLEETQAEKALRAGDITGYVRIPAGFVDAALRGDDVQVQYVAGSSPSSLGPLLMQEVADIVSQVVIHAQSGVYGFLSLTGRIGTDAALRRELSDRLTLDYVQKILTREQVFSVEYLGYSAGLGFGAYYFCAFFLLLVLLCGLPCTGLLVREQLALPRLLCSRGTGALWQVTAEFLPFFLLPALNGVLVLGGAGTVLSAGETALVPGLEHWADGLILGLRLLPSVLALTAMQYFLCSLVGDLVSGVLLQVLTLMVTAAASGYFFPLYSLPRALQSFSLLLPTRAAFDYAAGTLTGGASALLPMLWTAGLLAAAAAVRFFKLRCMAHDL